MKNLLTTTVAWLSASPHARFAPRLFVRDNALVAREEILSNETSTTATPTTAQSRPGHEAFFLNGSSTYVPPISTGLASALYTMSNADGATNMVLAYALNSAGSSPNGKINKTAPVARYNNGGNGLRFSFTTTTIQDALDSQGSLVQAGSRLFAVNTGSSTVQVYAVNCTNATDLIPLGKPVSTKGKNPTTIAVAQTAQIFCVATTGIGSAIECYDYSVGFGTEEKRAPQFLTGTNVSLPLPVAQNSNRPTGPADTVSQLLFTDDNKYLIAVVKSQLDSSGKVTARGYINVYQISESGLSAPVQSKPTGTKVLFGCALKYASYDLFCSDAGVGSVYLASQSDMTYKVTVSNPTASFGNGTNCWAQRSPFNDGPYYISPVDKDYIATFDNTGKYLATTNFAQEGGIGSVNPQLIEMAIANNYIYALSFGTDTVPQHILVSQDTNLKGSINPVQNILVEDVTNSISGMALFIPPSSDSSDTCDFK